MTKIETYEHIQFVQRILSRVIIEILTRINSHDQSELFSDKNLKYNKILNKYYPEYHKNGIKDMNLIDLTEMICDWFTKTKDVEKEIEDNQSIFGYSDDLKQILINTVGFLKK